MGKTPTGQKPAASPGGAAKTGGGAAKKGGGGAKPAAGGAAKPTKPQVKPDFVNDVSDLDLGDGG